RQIRKSDKLTKAALRKNQNADALPTIKIETVQTNSDVFVNDDN
ncbi:1665_t:CDS:1, partial [Acaulospora colombiana]